MEKKRSVIIKKRLDEDGKEIYNYIETDSPQNADSFMIELKLLIKGVTDAPKAFPSEPNLFTKRHLYRFALLMKSWKVIFKITDKRLVFLAIIHTARHPNEIKKLRTNNYE